MIKSNLSIIFSFPDKLLKLMHLDTGDKEIVLKKIFSLKKIKNETAYNSSTIFSQLTDFRIRGNPNHFCIMLQNMVFKNL